MYPLTIAAAIENPALWEQVQDTVGSLPVRIMVEQRELSGTAAFIHQLERARAEVVLLDVGSLREPLEDVVRNVRAAAPDAMVVALHTLADADTILSAFRAGVNEYICVPLGANLRRALEWKSSDQRRREGARGIARTAGFLSAKGGCGATTLACHVAMELGRLDRKVLLADFDMESGMVAFLTRARPSYSVADALHNIHRLDLSYWKALVSQGGPNVDVIPAPVAVASRELPRKDQVRHVLSFVRLHYDWTVVDMGRGLNMLTMNALDEIDEACVVSTLEIPALHQAKQIVSVLTEGGYPRERLRLILNRAPKRLEIEARDLERMIGVPVYAMVPNNYAELSACYSEGKLLGRNSKLGRQIGDIARKLSGVEVEARERRRFAFFG